MFGGHSKTVLALAVLLILATTIVNASPVTFFGEDLNGNPNAPLATFPNSKAAQNSFFANLTGVGTQTFESFANGTTTPFSISFPGAGTATLTGTGDAVTALAAGTTNGFGRYPTSGTNYLEVDSGDFAIQFGAAVAAFGFYGTDIGDFGGALTLTLTKSGGGTTTLNVGNLLGTGTGSPEDGSALYFGFYDTSTTYTSIAFNNSAAGVDAFGFDDFTIGSLSQVTPTTAPEPGSILLVASGGICLVLLRRRGSRRN